jgi:hypothetical protein
VAARRALHSSGAPHEFDPTTFDERRAVAVPRPRGCAMTDKSPRQTPSKKTKSLKEKRADKKAKKAGE